VRGTSCIGAIVAIAIGMEACAVGPQYQAPTPPAGATAPWISQSIAINYTAAPPNDWWRLYNDPRLDAYVHEALSANTNLRVAEANLSAAREILEAARAGQYPSTSADLGAVRGRDPVTDEILELTGRPPATIWAFDALFDSSYEVDLFGRVQRSIEAANADAAAVSAALDSIKVTIVAETTRAFAQICALGEQISVAQHTLDIASHESEITTDRRESGAGSEFEEVRAQTLVAQLRSTIPPLQGQRRASLFQLAALLGRTPAQAPMEAEACLTPLTLAEPIPVGDGSDLLKRRPDVREADRRLAGAIARVGVATADFYPRITLTGFVGGIGPHLSDLTAEQGLVWGVGPHVSWEFPNQSVPRARLQQAEAGERAALANFDGTILQALKETEQALTAYGVELEHHSDLLMAQTKSRRAYEIAHDQFVVGATSQLDLLTAEQSVAATDAAVAASDAALAQEQIALFKALGGGWRGDVP
jgi:multidrug efflux system outer membrane protein